MQAAQTATNATATIKAGEIMELIKGLPIMEQVSLVQELNQKYGPKPVHNHATRDRSNTKMAKAEAAYAEMRAQGATRQQILAKFKGVEIGLGDEAAASYYASINKKWNDAHSK